MVAAQKVRNLPCLTVHISAMPSYGIQLSIASIWVTGKTLILCRLREPPLLPCLSPTNLRFQNLAAYWENAEPRVDSELNVAFTTCVMRDGHGYKCGPFGVTTNRNYGVFVQRRGEVEVEAGRAKARNAVNVYHAS